MQFSKAFIQLFALAVAAQASAVVITREEPTGNSSITRVPINGIRNKAFSDLAILATTSIEFCSAANLSGACITFSPMPVDLTCFNVPDNAPEFNDAISSVKVFDSFASCDLFVNIGCAGAVTTIAGGGTGVNLLGANDNSASSWRCKLL